MTTSRAAWREPMVWLMLAIPVVTVAGGIATLRLARAGTMDAAPEPVQRTLQAQVTDLGADARAARLRLQATLRIDARGSVGIALPHDSGADALTLRLIHPTRADQDRTWKRAIGLVGFDGPAVPADARGRWVLESTTGQWRLVGEHVPGARLVPLQPAVVAP